MSAAQKSQKPRTPIGIRGLVALSLVLAGCAHSPQEVHDEGILVESISARLPIEAASCVARNAEAMSFGIAMPATASLRQAPAGAFEVVVSIPLAFQGTVGFIRIEPAAGGSRIRAWRVETIPGAGQLAGVAQGC